MSATNRNTNYPRCEAKNCWSSVDPHSQTGAVTVLLSLFTIEAANTSVMHNSDQITVYLTYLHDHKWLSIHWRSFSEWGGDRAAAFFAYKSWQYIGYAKQRPNHCVITILTKPQIIDALLTLILRMGWWPCCFLFCLNRLPIHQLCITATKSLCNYHTYKTTNRWRSVDAHSQNGAVTELLSLLPMTAGYASDIHNSDHITV